MTSAGSHSSADLTAALSQSDAAGSFRIEFIVGLRFSAITVIACRTTHIVWSIGRDVEVEGVSYCSVQFAVGSVQCALWRAGRGWTSGDTVSSRGRFAGCVDLSALDALAREHAFFFQGRDYRRQLPTLYRARQYRFCLIHQTFGGDVGSSGNGTCSAPSVRGCTVTD
jgi:hypothetical protein